MEAAEKSIKEAERLDTRHQYPQVAHLYGMILQRKKDYAGAVEHYHAYLKLSPNAEDATDSAETTGDTQEHLTAQK